MAIIDIPYIYNIWSDIKKCCRNVRQHFWRLFDFLFQCVKLRGGEELAQRNFQSIAMWST